MGKTEAPRPYDWKRELDFPKELHEVATRSRCDLDHIRKVLKRGRRGDRVDSDGNFQSLQLIDFFEDLSPKVSSFFTHPDNFRDQSVVLLESQDERVTIRYGNYGVRSDQRYGLLYFRDLFVIPEFIHEDFIKQLKMRDPEMYRKFSSMSKNDALKKIHKVIRGYSKNEPKAA